MMKSKLLNLSLVLNAVFAAAFGFWVLRKYQPRLKALTTLSPLTCSPKAEFVPYSAATCRSLGVRTPARTGEIIFLGDSLTAYFDLAAAFQHKNIRNDGISGDTTDCLSYRLPTTLRSAPSKLFLLIGINDLIRGRSVEAAANSLWRIVATISTSSPTTKIYVQSLYYPHPSSDYAQNFTSGELTAFNGWVKKIAAEWGATFIDLSTVFNDSTGQLDPNLSTDGLHLKVSGYRRWTQLLEPYLTQ